MNDKILFICGAPRSGTTFVGSSIRERFDYGICREGNFIGDLAANGQRFGNLEKQENLDRLITFVAESKMLTHFRTRYPEIVGKPVDVTEQDIRERLKERSLGGVVQATLSAVADQMGKSGLGNKFPDYTKCLPTLLEWFPKAKFLHVFRDGRDVTLSTIRKKNWGGHSAFACAKTWNASLNAVKQFESIVSPDQLMHLKYEELLSNPDSVIDDLEVFLERSMQPSVRNSFVEEISNSPLRNNFGKWKQEMTPDELRRFEAVAGNNLNHYGYQLETSSPKISGFETLYFSSAEFYKRPIRTIAHVIDNLSSR